MDIAAVGAASIDMHTAQAASSVEVAMLKKVMDTQEASAATMIQGLQQAAPSFGHQLDVYA